MPVQPIRLFGDPVLRTPATEVTSALQYCQRAAEKGHGHEPDAELTVDRGGAEAEQVVPGVQANEQRTSAGKQPRG